jgi:glycosyltransferase involved in cell wall biosynthesis
MIGRKLALVIPWYGPNLLGGAEMLARGLAEHLTEAGVPLEVLATCVRDFRSDWGRNELPPGTTVDNGVTVRRFPAEQRDTRLFDELNLRLMHNIALTPAEESLFVTHSVTSRSLTQYISAHQDDYTFVFIPYLYGTTYEGVAACGGKAWMIPCFHEESYAFMTISRRLVDQCQHLLLNSPGEQALTRRLYGISEDKMSLIGAGVDTDWTGSRERFRHKYALRDDEHLLLYAGRSDQGKRVDLLVDYFRRYRQTHSRATLVLIGADDFETLGAVGPGIRTLGFLPLEDKRDAFAAADVFIQPSERESFSLVLMEGWLAGAPALVNDRCEVTRTFCDASNGGLYFRGYPEFVTALELLLDSPQLRQRLGANGRAFVLANYSWPVIVHRVKQLLGQQGTYSTRSL